MERVKATFYHNSWRFTAYTDVVSRAPSIWSSPLLPLALAVGVVLVAVVAALASGGLSVGQTVAGGALLIALLVAGIVGLGRSVPAVHSC